MYGILLQRFFSLLQQLCTVNNWIFYMADVNQTNILKQFFE